MSSTPLWSGFPWSEGEGAGGMERAEGCDGIIPGADALRGAGCAGLMGVQDSTQPCAPDLKADQN